MNYYNEFDHKAAAWLRELIRAGLIPAGHVDTRSIVDVQPGDLAGYAQCHFFAGIGGWSLALQLAGWPADRPVWTGSCPCQPFSSAGKQLGAADERHLWPAFFNLIRQCRPGWVFGEQVESAIGHGWLDSVSADLEGEGYACGAAVLGAHSVGAPHRRQRLYWVADTNNKRCGEAGGSGGWSWACRSVPHGSMADCNNEGCQGPRGAAEQGKVEWASERAGRSGAHGPMEHPASNGRQQRGTESSGRGAECGRPNGVALGDTDDPGSQGRGLRPVDNAGSWSAWTTGVEFVACTDGKKRLVKSGIQPLAHGFPARVGILRGSGNAIVPQVAAEFIQAAIKVNP